MKKHFAALIGAAILAAGSAHAKVSQQTLDNFNAAFQGESNAAHRYEAFAQKAQAEGYPQAARTKLSRLPGMQACVILGLSSTTLALRGRHESMAKRLQRSWRRQLSLKS